MDGVVVVVRPAPGAPDLSPQRYEAVHEAAGRVTEMLARGEVPTVFTQRDLDVYVLRPGESTFALDEAVRERRRLVEQIAALDDPILMRCSHCGDMGWTIAKYGRVTHKEACPERVDAWSQTHPGREAA